MNMVLEEVSFFTNISYPLFFHTLFFPSSFFLLMLPSPEEATNLIKGLEYLLYKEAEKVGAIKPTEEKKKVVWQSCNNLPVSILFAGQHFSFKLPSTTKRKNRIWAFFVCFLFFFFLKLII